MLRVILTEDLKENNMEDWFNCFIAVNDPFQKHIAIKLNDVLGSIDDKLETLDTLKFMDGTFMMGTG